MKKKRDEESIVLETGKMKMEREIDTKRKRCRKSGREKKTREGDRRRGERERE